MYSSKRMQYTFKLRYTYDRVREPCAVATAAAAHAAPAPGPLFQRPPAHSHFTYNPRKT